MKDFFKSTRFKILVAVFIMLCAFMLRATWSGGLTPLTSQLLSVITTPLQSATAAISDGLDGVFRRFFEAEEIEQENESLKERIRVLNQQLADLEEYKRENEQLREYLGIKEQHDDFTFASASVIGRDAADRFYSFTIDAGSKAGIDKYDPVITSSGLVGIVTEVGQTYSKVRTILDVGIEVGVYDIRTRDIGLVGGDISLARQGNCKLSMLPKDSEVSGGDLIYTTGYGGLYPNGLAVGEVVVVRTENDGMGQYAVVRPAADIADVKDVLVITSFKGQGEQILAN